MINNHPLAKLPGALNSFRDWAFRVATGAVLQSVLEAFMFDTRGHIELPDF